MLLRRVIGDILRARRQAQHRTLREVSTAANVSLGYLSEIERGQKEASSELLSSICEALGAALSEVLRDVTELLAEAERAAQGGAKRTAPVLEPVRTPFGDEDSEHDGAVQVAVHHDGPLKTTLRATRTVTGGGRGHEVVRAA